MSDLYIMLKKETLEMKKKNERGIEFYEYRHTVKALIKIGWRHREIVRFFYDNVDSCNVVSLDSRIDNKQLMRLLSKWNTSNQIDINLVKVEYEKIKSAKKDSDVEQSSINVFSELKFIDFLRVYRETNKTPDEVEVLKMKDFFNEKKANAISIDSIVLDYINSKL